MDKMKPLIEGFARQIKEALKVGQETKVNPAKKEIRNIINCGMGGSGVSGNLVASLVQDELKVPFIALKSYNVPAFVNEHTLFIASSFSGNTEETIECLQKALNAGAQCCAITSGGKIMDMARENGMDMITLPVDTANPRANFGHSVIQLLFMLHYKELIGTSFINQLNSTVTLLEQEEKELHSKAKKLGNRIKGYLPIIYTDSRILPVSIRFQQQISENGKHLAHVNEFPDMNHNELVGWEHPEQVLSDSKIFFLKTDFDHPRVHERFRICEEILSSKASTIITVNAKGKSLLEQCFYLIHLTDWISYYLALANDADPYEVKVNDYLKSALSKP